MELKSKPSLDEATQDLSDIRLELNEMNSIRASASFLSSRDDVDRDYYSEVFYRVNSHIIKGIAVEMRILSLYPELK